MATLLNPDPQRCVAVVMQQSGSLSEPRLSAYCPDEIVPLYPCHWYAVPEPLQEAKRKYYDRKLMCASEKRAAESSGFRGTNRNMQRRNTNACTDGALNLYVSIHVYVCVHMRHINVHVYVCAHACTCICTFTYFACMPACTFDFYVCSYAVYTKILTQLVCVCVCVFKCNGSYMHAFICVSVSLGVCTCLFEAVYSQS